MVEHISNHFFTVANLYEKVGAKLEQGVKILQSQIEVEEWGKGKVWPSICGGINSLSACLLNRIELFFYIEIRIDRHLNV